jgi:hypothetical protein
MSADSRLRLGPCLFLFTVPDRISGESPQISADSQPILSPLSYGAVSYLGYKSLTGEGKGTTLAPVQSASR